MLYSLTPSLHPSLPPSFPPSLYFSLPGSLTSLTPFVLLSIFRFEQWGCKHIVVKEYSGTFV